MTTRNAGTGILDTLTRVPGEVLESSTTVYLVDGGTLDSMVARGRAMDSLRRVVRLPACPGERYGARLKIGYQYAIDQGLDALAVLPGDGHWPPETLSDILRPILFGEADLVVASGRPGECLPDGGRWTPCRSLGMVIVRGLQRIISRMGMPGIPSGYHAYSPRLLARLPFWENSDDGRFDTQVQLQAGVLGAAWKYVEMPANGRFGITLAIGPANAVNYIIAMLGFLMHKRGILYSRKFDVRSGGARYASKLDDPLSSHSKIRAKLLSVGLKGKRVLEYGVGDTALTRMMCEQGAVVDCVELDPDAAAMSRPFCRRVYNANLENINEIPFDGKYDIIVAADVLEHLKSPEDVLRVSRRNLRSGGIQIVSLPNVAHLYVRANLICGRFPYHGKGLLDRTHLHFYTYRSARRMLIQTGWLVSATEVTALPWSIVFPFLRKGMFQWFVRLNNWIASLLKGLFAYQFIFFCEGPIGPESR